MKVIRIVACRWAQPPEVAELAKGLEAMQDFVGGLVECVSLDERTDMWCNEEGLYTEPFNRLVPAVSGVHRIHGSFFLASHDRHGNTRSLSLAKCDEWLKKLGVTP